MKILVICNSSRSIVCSGRKAGHTVYALDNFNDLDLARCAKRSKVLGNVTEKDIHEQASSFGDIDAVIMGPGFEKLKFENMLNNKPEVMEEANDKLKIGRHFKSMDIPFPETALLNKASGLRYPLIMKPRNGSGGIRNVMISNEEELELFKDRSDANDFIAQEFVKGVPCSASLVCTGDDSVVVALNEQLIGIPWLTGLQFAYCGNITPFRTKFEKEIIKYAKQIALEWKLLGSNGVDFILSEKGVFAIEINPRFQGSLDAVELSTGMNIFESHVRSFAGELPELRNSSCFAAKAIVFANKDVKIGPGISNRLIQYMDTGQAADIPGPGRTVRADEPITTLLETGKTRRIAFGKIRKSALCIKNMTEA